MTQPPHLRLNLLGAPQLWIAGERRDVARYQRPLLLLAYLAVESHRAHPREALAERFWPDTDLTGGLRNLRQLLYRLRQLLQDDDLAEPHLFVEPETLRFNTDSDIFVDVLELNMLIAAASTHDHRRLAACPLCADALDEIAALYRGPFLDGWDLGAGAALESWALMTAESLARAAHTAILALGERRLAHGDPGEAAACAQRLLALDPWDEAALRLRVQALAADGHRAQALRAYRDFREMLAAELGLPPEDETEALIEALREGALSHDIAAATALPLPAAPFFGREAELAALARALSGRERRLITLLGPGGSGKTRLVLHVAEQQAPDWRHGVVFVPLADVPADDGGVGVVQAAVAALRLPVAQGRSPEGALLAYLRERELLLIFDNFEHLLPDGARLLRRIVTHAPLVKLLVTSQSRLNLAAEWIVQVGGLALPALDRPLESPGGGDTGSTGNPQGPWPAAVALFAHHAHRADPRWALTAENRDCVARICHLVEGLPLALELAAAWVRSGPTRRIAAEIAENLALLRSEAAHRPVRHRSLAATFDYAYGLLLDEDRQLVQKLSIFPGGFLTEAAEAVAGATLPALARLLDRSLLRISVEDRWDMHPLIRRYAAERLAQRPEVAEEIRMRHARAYLTYLTALAPALFGHPRASQGEAPEGRGQGAAPHNGAAARVDGSDPARTGGSDPARAGGSVPVYGDTAYPGVGRVSDRPAPDTCVAALADLDVERENVRAAWQHAVAARDLSLLTASAEPLARFLDLRGRFTEGHDLFGAAARALAGPLQPPDAAALPRRAVVSPLLDDLGSPDAAPQLSDGTAAPPPGAVPVIAWFQAYQAYFLMRRADYAAALDVAQAAQAAARASLPDMADVVILSGPPLRGGVKDLPPQQRPAVALAALALSLLVEGTVYRHTGPLDRAILPLEAAHAAAVAEPREPRMTRIAAEALRTLGAVHWRRSAYGRAIEHYEDALALDRALGDRRGEGWTRNGLALVVENQGHYDRALPLYQQALLIVTEIGDIWGQSIVLGNLGYLHARLGEGAAARDYYRRDLRICRDLGDRHGESWTQGYLSLLAHQEGRHRTALRHAERALALARAIDHSSLIATALTHMGHAHAGLEDWDTAEAAYTEALALRREAGEAALALETQAGRLRVALGRGQIDAALALAEEILAALDAPGVDRTDEYLRIYLACYRALAAVEDARAVGVLATAQALLMESAEAIADPVLRASFLENVAVHREITACEA
jgi:predicted ATPase/DNA-binding SARP family transcriptional activator